MRKKLNSQLLFFLVEKWVPGCRFDLIVLKLVIILKGLIIHEFCRIITTIHCTQIKTKP